MLNFIAIGLQLY